jgi:Trypsin-like peptidase domain
MNGTDAMSLPRIPPNFRSKIEAATVRFPRLGGQGVLVPGQLIVTAAHCVTWSTEGLMAMNLPGRDIESIETVRQEVLNAKVLAVEPVADIAVLGSVDEYEEEVFGDAFESFCANTAPVAIARVTLHYKEPVLVYVLAHTGRWVSAWARLLGVNAPTLAIEDATEGFEGGDSGGPVVTARGQLLGGWAFCRSQAASAEAPTR